MNRELLRSLKYSFNTNAFISRASSGESGAEVAGGVRSKMTLQNHAQTFFGLWATKERVGQYVVYRFFHFSLEISNRQT